MCKEKEREANVLKEFRLQMLLLKHSERKKIGQKSESFGFPSICWNRPEHCNSAISLFLFSARYSLPSLFFFHSQTSSAVAKVSVWGRFKFSAAFRGQFVILQEPIRIQVPAAHRRFMGPLSAHAARRSNSGYGAAIPTNIIRKLLETFVLVFRVPVACEWSCERLQERDGDCEAKFNKARQSDVGFGS